MGGIFTEMFRCPKATKKATLKGGLNGGGGGIRTNIFDFCGLKFYPLTYSIVYSWEFLFLVTFNNF